MKLHQAYTCVFTSERQLASESDSQLSRVANDSQSRQSDNGRGQVQQADDGGGAGGGGG